MKSIEEQLRTAAGIKDLKILTLRARVEELEKTVDLYRIKDDQVMFAMARLKEILDSPPWEEV